ncbi:MAG: ATP-dependent DNA helicase [Candidatus Micrarchaeia archaeon]|jgi:DNA excision repair protein ERCC-2
MATELFFRHDSFRKGQREIALDTWKALETGSNLLISAPTGCGKTDAVLSPAITYALREGLNVFFLTPKISQHEIACNVVAGIAAKYDGEETVAGLRAVDFVGRRHMCLDDVVRESDAFYELCNRRKKRNTCEYYSNSKKRPGQGTLGTPRHEEMVSECGPVCSHHELFSECKKSSLCPYEIATKIARKSNVVIADYHHIFAPAVRDVFLARIEKLVENSIVIVDEAHNLPSRVRDHLGSTLKQKTIERASQEAKALGNGELEKSLLHFAQGYSALKHKLLKKVEEVFVEPEELEDAAGFSAGEFSRRLADCGMEFLERFNKSKSASLRVGAFLQNWHEHAGSKEYVQIVHRERGLRLCCLDASKATKILNNARASVSMSGTLMPLEYYRDIFGLDEGRTILKEYPSPFEKEHKLNVIINSVTTRYAMRSQSQYEAIAAKLQAAISAMHSRETAIFFPAYSVMQQVLPMLEVAEGKLFVQRPSMRPHETVQLLSAFKEAKGVLCGVAGGSLSEGLDYNAQEIKCIAIVGVPLAEADLESKALVTFYDGKFGNGWDYAVAYPAMNRAVQAAGRGIRNESDKCIVLYLDERYSWGAYAKCLPKTEGFAVANEPWAQFKGFFAGTFGAKGATSEDFAGEDASALYR